MAVPQVIILDDIDIYDRGDVQRIMNVMEEKTFSRDKLINNEFRLEVKNFDNFYSVGSDNSYLKGYRWQYAPLKIYNPSGDLIWDGIIRNITRNHESGLAYINTISKLHKVWNYNITYTSDSAETPASAAKNIMDDFNIEYDSKTIEDSNTVQDNNGCYVIVNITEDDDVTLMAAIEKLAEYGCADAYSHFGKVYYKHFTEFAGNVTINLLESDLKVRPNVSDTEEELINDFIIPYNGGTITDTNGLGTVSKEYFGTHTLPIFDGGNTESQIYFTSAAGARYIGECYIKRTHINLDTNPRPPYIIDFELAGTYEEWIDLQTYFTLTFAGESWTRKVFEFFKTEINYNTNTTRLRALESQT